LKHKAYFQPEIFAIHGDDLPITGLALVELLQAVLEKNAKFRFSARGNSMTPFIRDGDTITVSTFTKISMGSIVAFCHPETNRLIVHRIVASKKEAVLIQGDESAEYSDGWIPVEYLLGKVTRIERSGRNILLGLGLERYLIAFFSRTRILTIIRKWIALVKNSKSRES